MRTFGRQRSFTSDDRCEPARGGGESKRCEIGPTYSGRERGDMTWWGTYGGVRTSKQTGGMGRRVEGEVIHILFLAEVDVAHPATKVDNMPFLVLRHRVRWVENEFVATSTPWHELLGVTPTAVHFVLVPAGSVATALQKGQKGGFLVACRDMGEESERAISLIVVVLE